MCSDKDEHFGSGNRERRKHRGLLEKLREGIAVVDPNEKVTYANPAADRIFGCETGKLVACNLREFVDDIEWQRLLEQAEARRKGETTNYELTITRTDGQQRIISVSATPEIDDLGVFSGSYGLIQDVTERKQIEAELAESKHELEQLLSERTAGQEASEEKYRQLVESVNVVPWEFDLSAGKFTYVGPQAKSLLGHPASEWTDFNSWVGMIHPEDQENSASYCLSRTKEGEDHGFDYRIIKGDGSIIWVRDIVQVISNEAGPQKLLGYLFDITESKVAGIKLQQASQAFADVNEELSASNEELVATNEELEAQYEELTATTDNLIESQDSLSASEQKFKSLFVNMQNGFALHEMVFDEDGNPVNYRFLDVNETFERQTSLRKKDIVGKCVTEVLAGIDEDPADWIGQYGRVVLTGDSLSFENFSMPLNKWYSVVAYRPAEGQFAVIIEDISERKFAEHALSKHKALLDDTQRLSKIGGFQWEVASQTMTWTDELYRIHGFNKENMKGDHQGHIGKSIECYNESDRPKVMEAFEQCVGHGLSYDLVFPFTAVDGTRKWIRTAAYAEEENDQIVRVIGNVIDISKSKFAEERATRLNLALESSLNEIYIFDAETFNFIQVNRGARKNLGYSMEEVRSLTPLDIKPEHTAESFSELVKPLRDGVEEMIQFNTIHRRKDGTDYFVEVHLQLMKADSPVYVAIVLDITDRKLAEQALRESEERFRHLTENATDMIYRMSLPDGRYEYVSPSSISIFGYTPEEFINSPLLIQDSIHPDWKAYFDEQWKNLLDGNMPPTYEYQVVHGKTKEVQWLHQRNVLISNDEGQPIAIEGIVTNVTERKQAEEAVLESSILIEESQEIGRLGSYVLDISSGVWTSSDVLNSIFGIPPDYKKNVQGWAEVIHPEDREYMQNHFAVDVLTHHNPFDMAYRVCRVSDGAIRWVHGHGRLKLGPNGEPVQMLGTIQDITEQKLAEELLKKQKQTLSDVLTGTNAGTWDWNMRTGEVTINARWAEIMGRTLEELTPATINTWIDNVHPDDLPHANKMLQQHFSGKLDYFDVEFRQPHKDGGWVWVNARGKVSEWGDDGKPLRMQGTHLDITDRKHAEEDRLSLERQVLQAQKFESLGVMAGGIAHDFNNLLMIIMGNADLALDELSPLAPARESIKEIETAAKRAAGLAKQMLAYSGKGKFTNETILLNEFVKEMAHLLEVSISKKAVLKYNFADNLPQFNGDATQIRQIIMNLIINASEAVGETSGVVSISTGLMDCDRSYLDSARHAMKIGVADPLPEGCYAYFEVSDTGCGMDKETLDKVFDPFFTTKFTGRGLGLAATLGIVRGHHGAIKIYSEVGKGTTFKVLFPVPEEFEKALPEVSKSKPSTWRGSGTILIADDEESILAVGRRMLSNIGFSVLTAEDGKEAVKVFREHKDDIVCVLLDLTMPHLDGNEAFREMRIIRPDVKVLLCSGYNEQEATQRFTGKGLAGFIQKPFTSKDLIVELKIVLEN